jgi:glycogen operon protein
MMDHLIKRTPFAGYGVKNHKEGTYFAANLPCIRECGVLIYDIDNKDKPLKITFDRRFSMGNVYSCVVKGLDLKGKAYRFFCDDRDFPDAYSKKIIGNEVFGEQVKESELKSALGSDRSPAGWNEDVLLEIPYEDSLIYEAHVRGLTMGDPSLKKNKGTFLGIESRIPYLKSLNVTALLLMPVYEFIEREMSKDINLSLKRARADFREPVKSTKVNYWGFCKAYPFAVKRSFSSSGDAEYEFKHLVKKLHANGIECLLTIHSDVAGTFDTMCELLHFYTENFHVDGFRIVGSRSYFEELVKDPFLKRSKLIFEDADTSLLQGEGLAPYRNVSVINEAFLRNSRRFLKSDEDTVSYMSYAVRDNSRYWSPIRNITDFSGFTLKDLFSYNRKHNEANNEENTDGTDYNYSWNCGVEGDTNRRSVQSLRMKLYKNAYLLMFLSQGTPLMVSGDEVLNSAEGNNNPYCQDNTIGWVSWESKKANREFREFVKNLSSFRKRHAVLHQPGELKLFDYLSCKLPDISFHSEEAWKIDQNPASREFAVLYCGQYARQYTGRAEDSIYVIYNMHWEKADFVLPVQDPKAKWSLLYSTDGSTDDSFDEKKAIPLTGGDYRASERSISILLLSGLNN